MAGLSHEALLAGISQKNFVILGRAGMDMFAHPPSMPISAGLRPISPQGCAGSVAPLRL